MRPSLFVFSSVGRLGHDSQGDGGLEGRMTIEYHFTRPGEGQTLFTRTMTIEAYRHAPLSDGFFRMVNPANIDAYHAAVARELAAGDVTRAQACSARRSAAPWMSNSCWLVSQSGSSESNPWQVPGNTCSSVGTPASMSRRA